MRRRFATRADRDFPALSRSGGFAPRRRWGLLLAPLLLATVPMMAAKCDNGPGLSLSYGATARENYELASVEFADRDYEESIRYADYVRIRFPFSRYAVEAELLVARSHFELREYLTSKDAFKQFAKLHPTHRHVRNGWVAYMVAVSAYMAAPDAKPGILPPHYMLDQSMLEDALVDFEYFFDRYPSSKLRQNAEKVRDEVQRRLLAHELYVARFYLDREYPEAAIGRLEAASQRYPGIGMDADILFLLGVTYLRVEEVELARSTFTELQTRHPEHHHGHQAKVYLRHIYDKYGPADPNRPRPDRSPPVPIAPPRPDKAELPEASKNPKQLQEEREQKKQLREAAPPESPEGAAPAAPAPKAPKASGTKPAGTKPAGAPAKSPAAAPPAETEPEKNEETSEEPEEPEETPEEAPEETPAAKPGSSSKPGTVKTPAAPKP